VGGGGGDVPLLRNINCKPIDGLWNRQQPK